MIGLSFCLQLPTEVQLREAAANGAGLAVEGFCDLDGGFAGLEELLELGVFLLGPTAVGPGMELMDFGQPFLVTLPASGVSESKSLGCGLEDVQVCQIEFARQDLVIGVSFGNCR